MRPQVAPGIEHVAARGEYPRPAGWSARRVPRPRSLQVTSRCSGLPLGLSLRACWRGSNCNARRRDGRLGSAWARLLCLSVRRAETVAGHQARPSLAGFGPPPPLPFQNSTSSEQVPRTNAKPRPLFSQQHGGHFLDDAARPDGAGPRQLARRLGSQQVQVQDRQVHQRALQQAQRPAAPAVPVPPRQGQQDPAQVRPPEASGGALQEGARRARRP